MTERDAARGTGRIEIVGLLAEAHVHVGMGQSIGALDLPVARERVTQYPFVPGSGVKGAFKVWAKESAAGLSGDAGKLFGKEDDADPGDRGNAGSLLCSDARLLLLPVRAMTMSYVWATCPSILRRLGRDLARTGRSGPPVPTIDRQHFLGHATDNYLGLEEREFARQDDEKLLGEIAGALKPAVPIAEMKTDLLEKLVVLHDDDFVWFARYGLPVMARNRLDEDKRVVRGNLWYEEALPPDTLLYVTFGERQDSAVTSLTTAVKRSPYIQMGGNETVGQGWFAMAPWGNTVPDASDAAAATGAGR